MSVALTAPIVQARSFVAELFGRGEWKTRELSHVDDEHVVCEFIQHDRGVVAKIYSDNRGRRCHRALTELSRLDLSRLRVPKPIAYDPEHRILLMERVEGSALDRMDLLEGGDTIERTGAALAEFHRCRARFGPPLQLADHVAELIDPGCDRLVELDARVEPILDDFLRRVASFDAAGDAHPLAPLHRDFHLRQLFEAEGLISVVDWDLAATGDPAFDFAYFTTYLRTHYEASAARTGIGRFVEGYCPDSNLLARVSIYECFNLLRRSCRRVRLRDPGWRSEVDWMLKTLESTLMGGERWA